VSRRLETIVATCSGKISVELKANNFVERKINAQVTFVQAAPSKRSDATIGFLQILGEQTRRSPKQKYWKRQIGHLDHEMRGLGVSTPSLKSLRMVIKRLFMGFAW
jgi:hypothetical protein